MKRQNAILFYILGIYALVQFAWWAYHLIELTEELKQEPTEISKRITMIMGEGLVFFAILLAGIWKIRSSIRKELKLSQQQNNFMLSVTHELKTPLASNKLYLQTILKRELDKDLRQDLLQKAIAENERLEALIDNILNAARLENQTFQAERVDIDLSALVSRIIERLDGKIQGNQSRINVDIAPSIHVVGDKLMLDAAISNLIDNALKYTQEEVKIQLLKVGDQTIIRVVDQGPGVPSGMETEIFLKFRRGGNEETRTTKGSGLGLFIASEFVKLHGGTITYSPNVPKGAIFQITL
ncbi:MAG: sensor histidine kinase [Flavobacteriia bacterium]|nr:ATP-binding protein [Cryomorphaceae bacterium]